MRILVGMSGGIDSSYAAKKLIDEGHTVEGAYLEMHEYTSVDAARRAADMLGIPLHVIDCRGEFDRVVRENFVSEYRQGRTPNPCVICNPTVKFPCLLNYALEHGFDRIATGHYARIKAREAYGRVAYSLAKALDLGKDQSYMLYRLSDDILSHLLLPLGDECKSEIRESIRSSMLAALDRKDSQEICFIPDGDYAGYIEKVCGAPRKGSFIDATGRVLGEHSGITHYTVGQRKGLGISLGERVFVTEIDPVCNTVRLEREPALSSEAFLGDVVLDVKALERAHGVAEVKIRYAAKPVGAKVSVISDERVQIEFSEPVRSLTPGQSAVIYVGDDVVGGGVICK